MKKSRSDRILWKKLYILRATNKLFHIRGLSALWMIQLFYFLIATPFRRQRLV